MGYCGNDLAALNIVCPFRNLIHLFDISKYNEITLNELVVSDYAKISHLHVFLKEEPLAADFILWGDKFHQLKFGHCLTSNISWEVHLSSTHPVLVAYHSRRKDALSG
jgi:hypothetical protein